jgi:hypothetical protein
VRVAHAYLVKEEIRMIGTIENTGKKRRRSEAGQSVSILRQQIP